MIPIHEKDASFDPVLDRLVSFEGTLRGLVRTVHKALGADMAMLSYLDADSHHVLVPSGFDLPPETGGGCLWNTPSASTLSPWIIRS